MYNIEVFSMAEAEEKMKQYSANDIVNLTFVQNESLSMATIKQLKSNYPAITKVMLKLKNIQTDDKNYVCNRTKLEAGRLFVEFYKQKKLVEPSREMIALFKELMEDKLSETN